MLSVVFKQGAFELADDTVAISDNFKPKPHANHEKNASDTKNKLVNASPVVKKEQEGDVFVLDDDEEETQEKDAKPYVFPSLAEKESEYSEKAEQELISEEENLSEQELFDVEEDEQPMQASASLKLMCDEMLQKAVAQASAILEDAHARAQIDYQQLISTGKAEIEDAKTQGYSQGVAEGTRSHVANIRACIEQLEHTVARIEGRQEEYLLQCEQDIKWLSLEIAQKLLNERISADELALYPLVKEAVIKQRAASEITVEISDDAPQLLQKLREELEKGDDTVVKIVPVTAPKGTCRLQTPEGFIDASLYRQLENLRDYFLAQPAD